MERLLLVLTGALILITHVESENGSRLVNWSKSHLTEKAEGLATNEFDPLRFFWDNNRKKAGYKIVKDRPPIFTYTDYDQSSYESDDYSSEIEQSSSESDCSDEYYDTYEYRENRRKTKRKRKRKHTPRPRKKITTRLTTKMPTATTRRTQATATMRPRTTRSSTRKTRRTKRPSKTTSLGTTTSPPTTSNRTTTATTPTTKKRRTRRTKRTRSTRKPRTTTQMTTRTSSATTKPTSASTPTTPTTKKRTRRTKRTRKPRTTTQMTTRRSSATRTRTSATTPTTPTTKKRRTRRTKRTRSTRKPRTTAQMTTRTSSATTKPASASTPTTPTTKKRTRRTKRTKSTRRPRTNTQMTTRRSTATRTRTSTTTPTTPTTRKRTRRTKSTTKTRSTTPNTSRTTTDITPKTSTSRRTTTRTTTDTTPKTTTSRRTTTRTTTDTAPKTSTSRRTTTRTTTDTTPKTSTSRSTTTRTTTDTTPKTSTSLSTTTRTATDTTSKTSTTRRSTTTQRSTTSRTTRMRTSTTKRPNAVVGVVDTSELPLEATRYYKERCPSTNVECKCPSSTIQSYDGTCNNLKHSGNGVADTIFKRVLIARYSDGKYEIAKSVVGNTTLPSVRSISVSVFGTNDFVDSTRTLLNPIYLMFLSQDIQEIATSKKAGKNVQLCCDPKGRMLAEELLPDNCQPIPISETDNFFSTFGQTCLNYQRRETAPECLKSGVVSQQINLRPSYLDLSVVYGSSENENKKLRAFEKGHMKTRLVPSGGRRRQSFLPTVENAEEVCGASNENSYCYLSANPKVNQIISLAALQTLFVRLHNGIADKLSSINSKWSDDELYHEARKITIALYHHFTYNEALPSLLGNKIMDRLGLSFKHMSHAYDEDVSAEALSEFAAVISPVISSLLPSKIRLQNEGRFNQAELELLDGKNHNSVLEEQSTLESALRGLTGQPSQSFDRHFAKELIEREITLDSMMKTGMDQIAVDIQVGRDLGISSYNDAREYCGMDRAVYFQGFDDVMSDQALRRLQAVYKSPEDVDLAVGILQENKVDGGMLGPTTSCILGEQFMRLRLADRFFANVAGFNHSFTEAQLNSILATRFSSVVCDATDQVESMQLDAFRPISKTNPLISCSELPALDLTPWHNSALPQDKCNKIK